MGTGHVIIATDEPPVYPLEFSNLPHLRHHSLMHYHGHHWSRSNAQGCQVLMDTNDGSYEGANNCGALPRGLPPAPAGNAAVASRPSSRRPTTAVRHPEPGGISSAIDRPSSMACLPSSQQVYSQQVQLQ